MPRPLGLIAGLGRFPFAVARAGRARGDYVFAAGIHGLTDPALADEVDELRWFHLGALQAFLSTFEDVGIDEAVMAGKVPKSFLYENAADLHLDGLALEMLAKLGDRKDDSLLGAFADALEAGGVKLRGQAELTPELLVPDETLTARGPSEAECADVAFGWPIAKSIAGLDIGQSILVKERAVIAVEAIEGTDAAVERAGMLGGAGCVVVKVAKPGQDLRFDVPVIGAETVEVLAQNGATMLAVEAHQTVFLERDRALERADALGLCICGTLDGELRSSDGSER
ncbi:MAG: UDP-2,3-diacylglucosamine diphosphatase LpxI [Myxococcota bacterium]|nr:UDP-2,3-diacylglucosamine diphosphatase LpxI [Myxococcota bacterium]